MHYYDFNQIQYKKLRDRVFLKSITGERTQLCVIHLEPGEKTDHSHPQEQIGYILSGEVEVMIGEERKSLGPGEGYYIPGGVRHGFTVGDCPVEYIEVFAPPKEENAQ
mgnify:CR=1 FL=1